MLLQLVSRGARMKCRNQNLIHRGLVLSSNGELRSHDINGDKRFSAKYEDRGRKRCFAGCVI